MNYLLTQELGDKIIKYLVSQPYHEVVEFIEGLKGLSTVNVVPPQTLVESEQSDGKSVEMPEQPPVNTEGSNQDAK